MIEIRGLTKRFGKLQVLDGVDLEIRRRRVTAIVGPNGAGKTTLIRSILGLTRADGGEILIAGERVNGDPRYRASIGYMSQIARFPENLTGGDLIAMLEDLRGNSTRVDKNLIKRFALDDQLAKPLRTLSGGTRQKVNAVMAFLFDPGLLVLDEPTAGLDPISSGVLKQAILDARDAGKAVLVTSHVMSELEALSDDVVFLVDGRVRYGGSVHDLKLATRQLSLERALAQIMVEDAVA